MPGKLLESWPREWMENQLPMVSFHVRWDREHLSAYASTKAQSAKGKLPGHCYYSKIDHFFAGHCKRGELYIEFLKGACEESGNECCTFCKEWSGPRTGYVPRPYPDYNNEGHHYMDASKTPLSGTDGKLREVDDYQP